MLRLRRSSCTQCSESYGRPMGGRSCFSPGEGATPMHLCYVDESGDAEALRSAIPDAAPVFVLVGVTVPQQAVDDLTWDFLKLKKELNPSLAKDNVRLSDLIQAEMKGSTLRADFRKDGRGRNVRRRAFRALDKIFELREQPNCQLVGKIVVKVPDDPNPPAERAVYSRAISEMAASFQAQLGLRTPSAS